MAGFGYVQVEDVSDEGKPGAEPKITESVPNSTIARDDSIGNLLKQQWSEISSLLTGQYRQAMYAVDGQSQLMHQMKIELSELRAENQHLRQRLQAAGLSSSVPPWYGMGGTGESSSSESKMHHESTAVPEERRRDLYVPETKTNLNPNPPSTQQVNLGRPSPECTAPELITLPGCTEIEVLDRQRRINPVQSSWSQGQLQSTQGAATLSSPAVFDKVEEFKDPGLQAQEFKAVLPGSSIDEPLPGKNPNEMITSLTEPIDVEVFGSDGKVVETIQPQSEGHGKKHSFGRYYRPSAVNTLQHITQSAPRAVFADAAAMKEKLRAALHSPEYNVADYYHTTGFWQQIARSAYFDNFTLIVIALNAIWIWIDTDYNDSEVLLEADIGFFIGENIFCVYFAFEWICRFMAFKHKLDGLKDSWFVFDSSLVFMMVFETWIVTLIIAFTSSSQSGGLGNASILRLLRLLRLTRMARMARLLRAMPELMILIKGMAVATRSVFFTLCLLVLIIYLFAIAFTSLTKGTALGDKYFKKVPNAMDTLLLGGTLPDHQDIVNEVGAEHVLLKFLFLVFMLLGSLTVMNMLMGVLVEVVSVVSSVEKEQMVVNFVKHQLQTILNSSGIDANCDNQISKTEFESLLEKPEAARALQDVGVDVVGLVDFTDFIFKDDIELSFPDFMEMVLQLRGTNTATVKDIVDFRKFLCLELDRLEDRIGSQGRISNGGGSDAALQAQMLKKQRTMCKSKLDLALKGGGLE